MAIFFLPPFNKEKTGVVFMELNSQIDESIH